jgi:hypothetical protein
MKFLILCVALLPLLASAQNKYTKFEYSDCGSKEVSINEISINPMPIKTPGTATFRYDATHKRQVSGNLKTKLSITRSVGSVVLPIKWFKTSPSLVILYQKLFN